MKKRLFVVVVFPFLLCHTTIDANNRIKPSAKWPPPWHRQMDSSSALMVPGNGMFGRGGNKIHGTRSSGFSDERHCPEAPAQPVEEEKTNEKAKLVKKESALAKSFVSGAISWVFEFSIGHPVEYMKILRQTTHETYQDILKNVVNEKGIGGIWDGFFPWGTIQATSKGMVFGWGHALAANTLAPAVASGAVGSKTAAALSGGFGGWVQGFVLSPTLLLKTRVMTDPSLAGQRLSPWDSVVASLGVGQRLVAAEGAGALLTGAPTFAVKRTLDWASRFWFTEAVADAAFRRGRGEGEGNVPRKLEVWEEMVASLVGGSLSTLATLPIDVAVAKIQSAKACGQPVNLYKIFADEFAVGGWEQVFSVGTRGLRARMVHVALTTMVMKTGASLLYDALYPATPGSSLRAAGGGGLEGARRALGALPGRLAEAGEGAAEVLGELGEGLTAARAAAAAAVAAAAAAAVGGGVGPGGMRLRLAPALVPVPVATAAARVPGGGRELPPPRSARGDRR